MTIKIIPLVIIFLVLSIKTVFAQSDACTVQWGPEMDVGRYESVSGWIGEDEHHYYLTSEKESALNNSGTYIKKIDHKLSLVASGFIKQDYKESGAQFHTEKILFFDGNLFLFSSFVDKKKKEYILFWKSIDSTTLLPTGSFNRMFATAYNKPGRINRYRFVLSPDNKKMLVSITLPGNEKAERDNQFVSVYNGSMELQWKKLITNDHPNINLGYVYRIDDKGNVYNKARNYTEKNGWNSKEVVSYSYTIIAFIENGEKQISFLIDVPQKFIKDISYKIDLTGSKIIVCGFYSNDLNKYGYDGCFYQQLDINSNTVLVSSFKAFDLNMLTEGMSEKEIEHAKRRDNSRKDQYFANYNLNNIIVRADGSVVLISECSYTLSISAEDGRGGYGAYATYHYDNLLLVNISASGNIEWVTAIPKTSHEQIAHQYASYVAMVKGDKVYLLFNDNIKNNSRNIVTEGVLDAQYHGEYAALTLATVNADGIVKREMLAKTVNSSVVPRPYVSKQISDDELFLIGEYEQVDQFAIIKFK